MRALTDLLQTANLLEALRLLLERLPDVESRLESMAFYKEYVALISDFEGWRDGKLVRACAPRPRLEATNYCPQKRLSEGELNLRYVLAYGLVCRWPNFSP